MNKKVIQVLIILVAFGGTGFVLYRGFYSQPEIPAESSGAYTPGASSLPTQQTLPYGKSLDFERVFNKQPLQFNALVFPKVDQPTEVGVPENELVKPKGATTPAG